MDKMMVTEGYKVQNETEVKQALEDIAKTHPEIKWERSAKREVLNTYRKNPKHNQHLVFFCIEDEHWFIRFLSDKEVVNKIPLNGAGLN